MVHPLRGGLSFSPSLNDFAKERSGRPVTVLSGGNNSGKSLVLKWLKQTMGKTAYLVGTNRFYHVYHFSSGLRDANALDNYESNFNTHLENENYNHENNFIDLNTIIIGLSDQRRTELFHLCGQLLGSSITMRRVDPDNECSPRYIDVDGQNLSVASTGTRLLITILGICMDDRFKSILLDEPELGLSPRIQRLLATFLRDDAERTKLFPHLKQVVIATHSQHFLDRNDLGANYVVSKDASNISLTRIESISNFHQLQFNLLGNSLEGLFLPSAIVFVEGDSDQQYIARLCSLRFPGRNVVVVKTDGDPKKRVYGLRETLGDLQTSSLRSRIFVVVDSVHNKGLRDELVGLGLMAGNFVAWTKNGIEYFYPNSILMDIFKCAADALNGLSIDADSVTVTGITRRKRELGNEVAARLTAETALPTELEDGLMGKLRTAIDDVP